MTATLPPRPSLFWTCLLCLHRIVTAMNCQESLNPPIKNFMIYFCTIKSPWRRNCFKWPGTTSLRFTRTMSQTIKLLSISWYGNSSIAIEVCWSLAVRLWLRSTNSELLCYKYSTWPGTSLGCLVTAADAKQGSWWWRKWGSEERPEVGVKIILRVINWVLR
jgi:hypothetical protein